MCFPDKTVSIGARQYCYCWGISSLLRNLEDVTKLKYRLRRYHLLIRTGSGDQRQCGVRDKRFPRFLRDSRAIRWPV